MVISMFLLPSCEKLIDIIKDHGDDHHGQQKLAKHFSSEVPVKWLNLQLRLTKVPPGVAGANPQRLLAYCGIAFYESIMEGMPSYQTLSRQLTDMPNMPKTQHGKDYHWATCANAALAFMSRNLLAAAPDASKASIDSLENALNEVFKTQTSSSTFERSAAYGKAIAQLIFDWSKTDGALNVNPPYTPPGTLPGAPPGLWIPFPSTAVPVLPYAGTWRLLVKGSNLPILPLLIMLWLRMCMMFPNHLLRSKRLLLCITAMYPATPAAATIFPFLHRCWKRQMHRLMWLHLLMPNPALLYWML